MAISGRKPKPQGQARHRNPLAHDWTEVVDVAFVGAPKLPTRRGGWPSRTRKAWAAWSTMPHCSLWTDSDWSFAVDSLEIAAQFHDGELRAATELRNREKVMGTTVDFRRDLRIRYVKPPEVDEPDGDGAAVANLDDYRELYTD